MMQFPLPQILPDLPRLPTLPTSPIFLSIFKKTKRKIKTHKRKTN